MAKGVAGPVIASRAVDEACDRIEPSVAVLLALDRAGAVRGGLAARPALGLSLLEFGDILEQPCGKPLSDICVITSDQ